MAMSLEDFLSSKGYNITLDPYEDNYISKQAALIKGLQQHSIGKDAVTGESINLNERQAKVLSKEILQKHTGDLKLDGSYHDDILKAYKVDVDKNNGKFRMRAGIESTTGLGIRGNRLAQGVTPHLQAMTVDSARLMKEGFYNSVGLMTKEQKLQFKAGNALTKFTTVLQPAIGAYFLGSELLNAGDVGEAFAMSAAGTAGMVGFNVGKSLAGMATPHGLATGGKVAGGIGRLALQGVMGGAFAVAGMATVGGAYYAAKDMMDSDSAIASAANKFAKAKAMGNVQQTQPLLTMRQKALHQLSQSSLNDRASVLGNEAAILRNLM